MLSALSLFSGAGGMDIGVRQAGFEILADIEIDPYYYMTVGQVIKGLNSPATDKKNIPDDSHIDITPAGDRS